MEGLDFAEWNGYAARAVANEGIAPRCAVCGLECGRVFCDAGGTAVGCDQCVTAHDPCEFYDRP